MVEVVTRGVREQNQYSHSLRLELVNSHSHVLIFLFPFRFKFCYFVPFSPEPRMQQKQQLVQCQISKIVIYSVSQKSSPPKSFCDIFILANLCN